MEEVFSNDLLRTELVNLNKDYESLEETHKNYLNGVANYTKLQNQCLKEVAHQRKRMKQLMQGLDRLSNSEEDLQLKNDIESLIPSRKAQLSIMDNTLPQKSGLYLRIILDGINVTFIDQEQRYKFKEQYEKFKLVVSALILVLGLLDLGLNYRAIDAILHFLLVWYHCTLTIRESILIVNGSRMKGWWRLVQFLETIKAGIIIVWPDGQMYSLFRTQFLVYQCYTTILQFLQFYYQQGCLYRLRALGERYDMDVTIQGFHSWMWKGLSFLIPFLYVGYGFQVYNAYTLYKLSQRKECEEWQVVFTAVIFLVLFLGNTITTSLAIQQKLTEKISEKIQQRMKPVVVKKDK
ncbi:Transmembrane protein -like protein [Halotydeus destructor]|nr:Transmembrane protein -like protein [Halotydeus destructor]